MLSCRINCISLMCIFMLPTTTTYETKCPDASHWRFRSKAICSVTSKYNCLFDDNRKIYLEFCTHAPDFLPAGRKYVVRGQRDGEDCERERYNPFIFKTNESSQCHYKKYKCNEDGQFKSGNGSTTNDASCRCDYRRNFAFIYQPKDPCHCVPSAEDCTCFKKDCPPGYHLSDDSSCISDYSITAPVCEIVNLTKGDEMYKFLTAIRKSNFEPDISSNSLTEGFVIFKRIRKYDLTFVTLVFITMLCAISVGVEAFFGCICRLLFRKRENEKESNNRVENTTNGTDVASKIEIVKNGTNGTDVASKIEIVKNGTNGTEVESKTEIVKNGTDGTDVESKTEIVKNGTNGTDVASKIEIVKNGTIEKEAEEKATSLDGEKGSEPAKKNPLTDQHVNGKPVTSETAANDDKVSTDERQDRTAEKSEK